MVTDCESATTGPGAAVTYLRYELSASPKMANRSGSRQFVLLSFSRLRFFQNLSVFFGMSPWPVVDVTKTTSEARRMSACA